MMCSLLITLPVLRSAPVPETSLVSTGSIVMIISGTCGVGFTEVSSLSGRTLVGTVAANGDVGTTGGSDTITPTVATLTAAAQTFTGSSANTSAVSAGTPAGTNGTVTGPAQVISWPAGVPTFAGSALATHQHELPMQIVSNILTRFIASATFGVGASRAAIGQIATTANTTSAAVALSQAVSAGTPAGTVAWPAGVPMNATSTIPAETFTGSALGTHLHAVTAIGTNGTSAVTGTLNNFDNRSAFLKVIFCVKT